MVIIPYLAMQLQWPTPLGRSRSRFAAGEAQACTGWPVAIPGPGCDDGLGPSRQVADTTLGFCCAEITAWPAKTTQ